MEAIASMDAGMLLMATLIFGATCLAVWLLLRFGTDAAAAVPPPDTAWRDPPPRYWRLLGFAGHAVGHWISGAIPRTMRMRLIERLRQGGLEYALTVDLYVAGQVIAALLVMSLMLLAAAPIGGPGWWVLLISAAIGAMLPASWLHDRIGRRAREIVRTLPFYLDVITLAIEAGTTLTGALQHAADRGPRGAMADELHRVLRDVRAGRPRAEAMRMLAERLRLPAVSNWVAAVLTAERQGASLGPILRAQAEQRRNERFLRAEALAMKAPVKMLFPLMTCIFPCTFVIVLFPVVVQLLQEGVLK